MSEEQIKTIRLAWIRSYIQAKRDKMIVHIHYSYWNYHDFS